MTGALSDPQGVSAGEPTSNLGAQPHYRFTRQPVKYHRHHNAGSRLPNPSRTARQVAAPDRAQPGSADSSCSSSPELRTQRLSHHSDAHFDFTHQPRGVADAAEGKADMPLSPREVVQYMLGLESTFPSPGAAVASGTAEERVQEAAAGSLAEQSMSLSMSLSTKRQSAGQSHSLCQSPKTIPVLHTVNSPAQKILSGLKLRRSHSGKDEQLFV